LYSTFIRPGDAVNITVYDFAPSEQVNYSVLRLDYTTDDEGNDMGIKEVPISVTPFTGSNFSIIDFTASTATNAYNFEYKVSATVGLLPTPTPTATPTPTPTPTPSPSIYGGVNSIVRQAFQESSGKYIFVGDFTLWNNTYALNRKVRVNTNGSLDTSYNPTIMFAPSNLWSALLTTGELLNITQGPPNYITKYDANGNWPGFTAGYYLNLGFGIGNVWRIWPGSGGKFYLTGKNLSVSGSTPNSIIRFNNDLTVDTSFTSPLTSGTITVIGLVEQADGKVVCNGDAPGVTGVSIVRLNSDGTTDGTFACNVNTGPTYDIKIGPGGKIYYAGYNTGRLNTNGTFDSTFNSGVQYPGITFNIDVQSDGKSLLTGDGIINYGGYTPSGLFRLNNNGSFDTTFNSGGSGPNSIAMFGEVIASDKIIAFGDFTTYNGVTYNRIMRLNSNGSIDTSFIGT
jgi:uncharacterized delta-60 repeat protein